MAQSAGSSLARRRTADIERAARMKAQGITRTTQRCPVCYRIVSRDSERSRYSHNCMR